MSTIPDEITLYPITSSLSSSASDPSRGTSKPLLVYFITGNPGLIAYYTEFIRTVQHNLSLKPIPSSTSSSSSEQPKAFQDSDIIFHGTSLDGFELSRPTDPTVDLPLSLPQQITQVRRNIGRKVAELTREFSSRSSSSSSDGEIRGPMPVVLMGHSVGAYILMEVIAQWQAEQGQRHEGEKGKKEDEGDWRPVAGINLFPTVTEIAKSEKGRQLSWFLNLPHLPVVAHYITRVFQVIPRLPFLDWAAALNPGPLCREVTAGMVTSRNGIRQLLYMANDEMHLIKEDRWLPALWGDDGETSSSSSPSQTPDHRLRLKLYFYFGARDYWVDSALRDELISTRKSRGCSTSMEICPRPEIPHTFSLDAAHLRVVADEVVRYLAEVRARVL